MLSQHPIQDEAIEAEPQLVHIWVVARQTNLFYLRNQLVLFRKFTYFPQQNNSYSPENQLIFRPFSFAE